MAEPGCAAASRRTIADARRQEDELRRQEAELRRQADELRHQADGCAAEAATAEAALPHAEAKDACTAAFWSSGGNLLTGVTDDTLLAVARFLPTATDLLRLGQTCTRFSTRCIASGSLGVEAEVAAGPPQLWSIGEEVARRWIAECTEQQRGWVPWRACESWLGLMHEVETLRRAAVFGRSHETIAVSEGGALLTVEEEDGAYEYRTAASKAVMRAGRHYVQFTVESGDEMFFGMIRPGWDVEGGYNAKGVHGHCFYDTSEGSCWPGDRDWEGMQGPERGGDRIGMLLDLDQGSMTVYKNDERLGVMATGLSGEYCWAVSLYNEEDDSARIDAAAAPASPTAEQLAQAVAYEAEQADGN
jgi:hypothetical protein